MNTFIELDEDIAEGAVFNRAVNGNLTFTITRPRGMVVVEAGSAHIGGTVHYSPETFMSWTFQVTAYNQVARWVEDTLRE